MKRIILHLVVTMTVAVGSLAAQVSAPQYFPLDSGNVWQYYVTLLNPEPPDSNYYMTARVLGDTLMPNGKRYKVIDKFPLSGFGPWYGRSFVRIDSITQTVRLYSLFRACPDSELAPIRLVLDSMTYHDCRGVTIMADTGRSQIGLIQHTARHQSYSWFDGFSNHYILHEEIGMSFFRQWELAGWQGRLVAARINGVQYGTFVGVLEQRHHSPDHFVLRRNYPNPFNPSTIIKYEIPSTSYTTLKVFDVLGREVATLVDGVEEPGYKSVQWDASGVASGVYFYRLSAAEFVQTKKLLILK
ncbi:MAG: T9SS type A sorting domain-containing protein [Bacteroidota bacterium]|mgnify:CR=1 FL=1